MIFSVCLLAHNNKMRDYTFPQSQLLQYTIADCLSQFSVLIVFVVCVDSEVNLLRTDAALIYYCDILVCQ